MVKMSNCSLLQTNELLLGGRTLTASEALRAGLVTRVLWPDRFQGELLPSLKSMSEQSSQVTIFCLVSYVYMYMNFRIIFKRKN